MLGAVLSRLHTTARWKLWSSRGWISFPSQKLSTPDQTKYTHCSPFSLTFLIMQLKAIENVTRYTFTDAFKITCFTLLKWLKVRECRIFCLITAIRTEMSQCYTDTDGVLVALFLFSVFLVSVFSFILVCTKHSLKSDMTLFVFFVWDCLVCFCCLAWIHCCFNASLLNKSLWKKSFKAAIINMSTAGSAVYLWCEKLSLKVTNYCPTPQQLPSALRI